MSKVIGHIRFSLACGLILTLLTACGQAGPSGDPDLPLQVDPDIYGTGSLPDLDSAILTSAESIFQAINVNRAEAGVPGLLSHATLVELAYFRSTDMAVRSYTSHEDPVTGEFILGEVLSEAGYSGPAAELVFAARDPLGSVPERVSEAWFDDPMHKALLLEPSFRFCGIGLMGDGDHWKVTLILAVSLPEEGTP